MRPSSAPPRREPSLRAPPRAIAIPSSPLVIPPTRARSRYRQNVVVNGREGAVYLYGGESYQPYMYHNAVNRLELPEYPTEATLAQMLDLVLAGDLGGFSME